MKLNGNTRGIRNCNFGNIRLSTTKWLGEIRPSRDGSFCTFSDYEYGIRALYILLRTYVKKYGLVLVPDIIARYAPCSENDTKAYIKFVDDRVSFRTIDERGYSMLQLISAICEYESKVEISTTEIHQILQKFNL